MFGATVGTVASSEFFSSSFEDSFFFFFPLLGLHYGKRSGFVPLPALHAVIKVPRGRWPAVASAGEALCWSVAAACRLVASAHHVRGAFLIKREPVGATSCGNSAWS